MFQASASPSSVAVDYVFDHGDGTLDPGARSDAYYLLNGLYRVTLKWTSPGNQGEVDCGVVSVLTSFGCFIGLGPADGLGWWCGGSFCDPNRLTQDATCPHGAVWGCYTGQDGSRRCIDPPVRPPAEPTVTCAVSKTNVVVGERLLFTAASTPASVPINFVFDHGDGTLDPGTQSHAFFEAPGQYVVKVRWKTAHHQGVVDCGIVTVSAPGPTPTPSPPPVFRCSISKNQLVVGETTVFTAERIGGGPVTEVAFLHGDGTRDPRAVSHAFYAAPGNYLVTFEWATPTDNGSLICGTVTVS